LIITFGLIKNGAKNPKKRSTKKNNPPSFSILKTLVGCVLASLFKEQI
jgi:hypothetical protein